MTIDQQREAASLTKFLSLLDVATRQAAIATSKTIGPSTRIQADKLLVKVLGYEAPQEIRIQHRQEIFQAISILSRFDCSPNELLQQLKPSKCTPSCTLQGNDAVQEIDIEQHTGAERQSIDLCVRSDSTHPSPDPIPARNFSTLGGVTPSSSATDISIGSLPALFSRNTSLQEGN